MLSYDNTATECGRAQLHHHLPPHLPASIATSCGLICTCTEHPGAPQPWTHAERHRAAKRLLLKENLPLGSSTRQIWTKPRLTMLDRCQCPTITATSAVSNLLRLPPLVVGAPDVASIGDQLVACRHSSAAILIVLHFGPFPCIYGMQHWREHRPGGPQFIPPHEMLLVAEHSIKDEPLVRLWNVLLEPAHRPMS